MFDIPVSSGIIRLNDDIVISWRTTNLSSYSRESSKPPISLIHFNVTLRKMGTSKNCSADVSPRISKAVYAFVKKSYDVRSKDIAEWDPR